MSIPMDGSFYTEGRKILKAPKETKREDGSSGITIGFPVAEVLDYINNADDIARAIAEAMNASPLRG